MGLDIVTNIMADQASNDLATNQSNMQSSLQKLSSGYQINTAADDASGLVISQHLQAQIGAFQQAQKNTQAGINVVQTADGALNEVATILQRINTLAVESQNSSATDATAQQAAQAEVNQALSSLSDIANTTVYGDNHLLANGSAVNISYEFQVGYDGSSSSQVSFQVSALTLANLGLVMNSVSGTDLTGTAEGVSGISTNLAAGNYSFTVAALGTAGTGFTVEVSNASGVILGTATVATTATSADINLASGVVVDFSATTAFVAGSGTFAQNYGNNVDTVNYSVTSSNAIANVQNAIQLVASLQGQFGSYQNELQDISNNETVGIQNLTASNANIMDTNMATQMVKFTQDQVLVQAGVSMLAQANQIPQYVLKLLS